MRCVDTVSLGNVARSTTSVRYPLRASNIATGDPAHRAPTTMTSYARSVMSSPSAPDRDMAILMRELKTIRRTGRSPPYDDYGFAMVCLCRRYGWTG